MTVSMAYALTRMHARVAERPTQEARQRLLALEDFGHFLQSAARVGFGRWLTRLGPASTSHQVELSLRLSFRELLHEVTRWLPARWLEGIAVLKLLPDLPALDRLMRGAVAHAWMRHDPLLAPLLDEAGRLNHAELARAWPALADVEADALGRRWLSQVLLELPAPRGRAALELRNLLQGQVEPVPGRAASRELERVFRRQADAHVRVVAFAVLARQDLEFLRGQLARRSLLQTGGP